MIGHSQWQLMLSNTISREHRACRNEAEVYEELRSWRVNERMQVDLLRDAFTAKSLQRR
jgi:hypothetical protein